MGRGKRSASGVRHIPEPVVILAGEAARRRVLSLLTETPAVLTNLLGDVEVVDQMHVFWKADGQELRSAGAVEGEKMKLGEMLFSQPAAQVRFILHHELTHLYSFSGDENGDGLHAERARALAAEW